MTSVPQTEPETWAGNYPDNWQNFARASTVYYGILVLVLAGWFLGRFFHSDLLTAAQKWAFYPLLLIWIPLGLIVDGWKCPRCKKRFSPSGWDTIRATMHGPDLSHSITRYVSRLPRRISHVLHGKGDSYGQKNEPSAADRCRHCGLPKY